MSQQIVTEGIVLSRTDYGEADRILTILTPDHGKISVLAKGVRKIKSKLAGGIELLSVSDITYLLGRGDMGTLLSARLRTHFGNIVEDLDTTMLAYEFLKRTNRATEDEPGPEYFDLVAKALTALNESCDPKLVEIWFDAQLLKLAGHQPNLLTDASGEKLSVEQQYNFDFETMSFSRATHDGFSAAHIKFLRLVFAVATPALLQQVTDVQRVLSPSAQLVATIRKQLIRK